jgi:proteasome lid subunit RPN8/RPN11
MSDQPRRRPLTSIYVKTHAETPVPEDEECYYLLTGSGLFIGRNTPLHRSLVPARQWPRELASQKPFLKLNCPRVPAELIQRIVGFFWIVACRHGAEAAVLLALDESAGRIVPIVPRQVSTVGTTYNGYLYPVRLLYDTPPLSRSRLKIIGDVHSHVFEAAYASSVDVSDEIYRPGLHLVAGRVDRDPPQWHAEYVVDGKRFTVAARSVMETEGYSGRSTDVPPRWLRRVRINTVGRYGDGYHETGTNHTSSRP